MAREFKHGYNFKIDDMPQAALEFESGSLRVLEAPGELLVKEGQEVFAGTPLADDGGFMTLSPVSGKITSVRMPAQRGGITVINIESDGGMNALPQACPFGVKTGKTITEMSFDDALSFIKQSGITEGGGGTRPTYKLMKDYAGRTDKLVINAARDLPGAYTEAAYAVFEPEKLIGGVKILMIALGIKKGIIALSSCDRDRAERLFALTGGDKMVTVETVCSKYPQSEDHLLIYALSGRELSPLRRPSRAGYAIFSAKSAVAVYEAFAKGLPPFSRYLSISDESGSELLSLPVGTPLSDIISRYDITSPAMEENFISGRILPPDSALSPGTDNLYFHKKQAAENCFGCNKCTKCVSVCPMYLFPYEFAYAGPNRAEKAGVLACIGCGLCEYVCPSEIGLSARISELKTIIMKERYGISDDL